MDPPPLWLLVELTICYVTNEVTGAKMCSAIVSEIVNCFWGHVGQLLAKFFLAVRTVPEFFAKNNSPQFPRDFHSKYNSIYHILPERPCVCFNLQFYFNSTHTVSHRFIQSLLEKVVSVPRIRSPSSDMMDLTVMRKNIFPGLGMTMMITVMAGRASMRIPWTDRGLDTSRPVLSK